MFLIMYILLDMQMFAKVIAVTFLYYALSIINIVHRIYYGAHLNKLVF